MTRIDTTLWELAMAIFEEAEQVADGDEAQALASMALADFLQNARLVNEPSKSRAQHQRRPSYRRGGRPLHLALAG